MAERSTRVREPDSSIRGDANIPDFIAQQQGVADLADFALQSNAGAALAGGVTADGAQLTTAPPLASGGDISAYTPSFCTIALDATVTDPVGAGASISLTPVGTPSSMSVTGPSAELPAGQFVHLVGGFQFHRVTNDVALYVTVHWYDAAGVAVNDVSGSTTLIISPTLEVFTAQSDIWQHVDTYLQVPTGAVLYSLDYLVQPAVVGSLNAAELAYLNNFQIKGASQFDGVHSGRASRLALWKIGWGQAAQPYRSTTYSQAVTSTTGVNFVDGIVAFQVVVRAIARRRLKITLAGIVGVQSVATGTAKAWLLDPAGNKLGLAFDYTMTAGQRGVVAGTALYETKLTEDGTNIVFNVLALVSAGTCTFSSDTGSTVLLLVEDIGPAGEPPEGFV